MHPIAASPILLTVLASLALAIVLIRRSRRDVRLPFASTCIFVETMQFATYAILVIAEADMQVAYLRMLTSIIPFIPSLLLIMVVYIVGGGGSLTRVRIAAILAFPSISAVVVLANLIHHLFGSIVDDVFVPGPWRMVVVLGMVVLSTIPLTLLVQRYLYAGDYGRRGLSHLMLGIAAVILINPMMTSL